MVEECVRDEKAMSRIVSPLGLNEHSKPQGFI